MKAVTEGPLYAGGRIGRARHFAIDYGFARLKHSVQHGLQFVREIRNDFAQGAPDDLTSLAAIDRRQLVADSDVPEFAIE